MKIKRLIPTIIAVIFCLISTSAEFTNVSAVEIEDVDVWDGSYDTFWYNANDTEFFISTAEEFAGLAKLVNSGNSFDGKIINLYCDIKLNSNPWMPIGMNPEYPFNGTFNGNNYVIYGLNVYDYDYAGLFGVIEEYAVIKNTIIDDTSLINGKLFAGSIVAKAAESATINSCISSGNVNSSCINYNNGYYCEKSISYAGGITGYGGNVRFCGNYGNVSAIAESEIQPDAYAGGISGASSTIVSCFNKGDVYAKTRSYASASYSRVSYSYAGGISGYVSKITNCYNCGKIDTSTSKYSCTSGILAVGYAKDISNSYNVGYIGNGYYGSGIIYSSYNFKEMTNVENSYYLNGSASCGIGNVENDTVVSPNEASMKKESFAQTLGNDFVYVEGDYPKLAWEVNGFILGDINSDGEFNISDVVILQKWLLGAGELTNWKAGDLCEDNILDVFDLCMMKRKLIEIV